jgi:tripeptidyl-peptidase I
MSPSTSFNTVVIDLGSELQLDTDIEPDGTTEADLDIEYTIGLATGVPVTFLSVGNNYQDGELDGYLDTVNYLYVLI